MQWGLARSFSCFQSQPRIIVNFRLMTVLDAEVNTGGVKCASLGLGTSCLAAPLKYYLHNRSLLLFLL